MSHERSFRRAQRRRIFAKRLKNEMLYAYGESPSLKSIIVRATIRVTTNVRCSCTMCTSPRHVYGNGKNSKTRQEIQSDITYSEALQEI